MGRQTEETSNCLSSNEIALREEAECLLAEPFGVKGSSREYSYVERLDDRVLLENEATVYIQNKWLGSRKLILGSIKRFFYRIGN